MVRDRVRQQLQELRMRQSPSIAPDALSRDVYLVLDDVGGRFGLAWPAADVAATDRPRLIRHLLEGQLYVASPHRRFQHRRGLVARRDRGHRCRARPSMRRSWRDAPVDRGVHRRPRPAEPSALI